MGAHDAVYGHSWPIEMQMSSPAQQNANALHMLLQTPPEHRRHAPQSLPLSSMPVHAFAASSHRSEQSLSPSSSGHGLPLAQ